VKFAASTVQSEICVHGLICLGFRAQARAVEKLGKEKAVDLEKRRPQYHLPHLPLRELESLASALLAVLFTLVRARVARQESGFLEAGTEFRVELHEGAGDSQSGCARLANIPAAIGKNQNIKLFGRLGRQQRLAHHRPRRLGGEICVEWATVYSDRALARAKEHTGNGSFPPTGAEMLNQSCH